MGKKIAIVTPDLIGPIRNGGVGTAYSTLARLLASDGHEVTVLFANGYSDEDWNFHHWQREYAKQGIELLGMIEPPEHFAGQPGVIARSYAVFSQLLARDFDVIHFPDLMGIGYCSTIAKKMGIAFQNSVLVGYLHGPNEWVYEGNHGLPVHPEEILGFELERKAIESMDILLCPSSYARDWAEKRGWKLPAQTLVMPYPVPNSAVEKYSGRRRDFDEIVFFGRIESRKGIDIFCKAIELLPQKALEGRTVVFLGRWGYVDGGPAKSYVLKKTSKWKVPVEIKTSLNQNEALAYLRKTNSLVVIPSRSETLGFTTMECIQAGIPVIVSDIPPFRELVHPDDWKITSFELNEESLARKLRTVMGRGLPELRMIRGLAEFNQPHVDLHRNMTVPQATSAATDTSESLSIIVRQIEDPARLSQMMSSLATQSSGVHEVFAIGEKPAHFGFGEDSKPRLKWVSNLESALGAYGGSRLLLMTAPAIFDADSVSVLLQLREIDSGIGLGYRDTSGKEEVKQAYLPLTSSFAQNIVSDQVETGLSLWKKRPTEHEIPALICPMILFSRLGPFPVGSGGTRPSVENLIGNISALARSWLKELEEETPNPHRARTKLVSPQRTDIRLHQMASPLWTEIYRGSELRVLESRGARIETSENGARLFFTRPNSTAILNPAMKTRVAKIEMRIGTNADRPVALEAEWKTYSGKHRTRSRSILVPKGKGLFGLELENIDLSRGIELTSKYFPSAAEIWMLELSEEGPTS